MKEFEQEAELDGMLPALLADRKRPLAEALVGAAAALRAARADAAHEPGSGDKGQQAMAALGGNSSDGEREREKGRGAGRLGPRRHPPSAPLSPPSNPPPAMSTPEIMAVGRSLIKETDAALARSVRVVADTTAVGAATATALAGQTEQLERVLDDADALREQVRKARRGLVDVARGAATDR
jgi:hypothetical protein